MNTVHRSATALLAANLGLGLVPFVLLAFLHPSIRWQGALAPGICLVTALSAAWILMPDMKFHSAPGQSPLRRLWAGLLLGASLTAIPWKQHYPPFGTAVICMGFALRWWLFALETLEIRRADRRCQPLPSFSTRGRRICTLITAAIIPLLMLSSVSSLPLLWISFVLTLLCQWTVGGETCYARFHQPVASSIRLASMSGSHDPDGGIY